MVPLWRVCQVGNVSHPGRHFGPVVAFRVGDLAEKHGGKQAYAVGLGRPWVDAIEETLRDDLWACLYECNAGSLES